MNSSNQAPSHKVGSSMCTCAGDKKCTKDEKRGINIQQQQNCNKGEF